MKSDFFCSMCSKVFKKPITFPCGCTVCGRHLNDKEAKLSSTIKCVSCNIDYSLKELELFKPNKTIENLLSKGVHLSDEENMLKQQIEQEMVELYKLCNEFREKNSLLEIEVYDHFVELRRKIDIRREEAKTRIDDIYMEMIDLAKKTEAQYMDHLKKQAQKALVRSRDDSLEKEKENLEDRFRETNILIENVKAIKTKHQEDIAELKNKLKEFDEIKKLAKENEFKSGVVFDKILFGSLNLVDCPSSHLISKIANATQYVDLMKVCEFSINDKWRLLYRGSENGFDAKDFHSKCEGKSNTLTIIKANGTSNIFGGFASAAWDSSSKYKQDGNAFLFSLVNQDNKPLKMKTIKPEYAIYCHSSYGPTFGFGFDIHIASNSNSNTTSYSNLGHTYKHPQYAQETTQSQSFLAGSRNFQVNEIEVYAKI